jgi:hypothetical protein
VDVTITVDRSVDPFGSLVAAGPNVIAKSFDEHEVAITQPSVVGTGSTW